MANFSSILYQILGERIKAQRESKKMNQSDLGDKVGIGRTSISNIEKGRQKPPLSVIYKICHELDLEVYSVLPTYIEIQENIQPKENPLKLYYDKYNLNEDMQKEIDSLFKKKKDDN